LSTNLANSIISYWEKIGVVVPPQAIKGVFTIYGFDNIDYNPSSSLGKFSFRGSCTGIIQHFKPKAVKTANECDTFDQEESGHLTTKALSEYYRTRKWIWK
jgi:hypothetical protein